MNHLEYLKNGFEEAQKRFQEAQREFAVAQTKFNGIAQEFNAWQILYQSAVRKEQAENGNEATAPALPNQTAIQAPRPEQRQTEAVRELLRQRPGMTPGEIWKQLESQLSNRAYLYSVLKRLRDRGDAMERKGKYFLKPRAEETREVLQ